MLDDELKNIYIFFYFFIFFGFFYAMSNNVIENLFIYFSFHNMFESQGPMFLFLTNFCITVTQKNLSCKLYKGFHFYF
jgi:hypothetical protein